MGHDNVCGVLLIGVMKMPLLDFDQWIEDARTAYSTST